MKRYNAFYIYIIVLIGLAVTVVFDFYPRSKFSELEKRELKTFPAFTWDKLASGKFTSEVSSWFSDSEPFRDKLMTLSMQTKKYEALNTGAEEDQVSFHASNEGGGDAEAEKQFDPEQMQDYENNLTANENAKIASAGIIVVGSGPKVRALMAYGGGAQGGTGYSDAANLYHKAFGNAVQIYCMVIPTAAEFYCPTKAKKCTKPQLPTIKNIYSHLDPGVKAVDIYTPLSQHAKEDIYLRTDHHWSPRGAYYAAQAFAKVAGVPFKDLNSYEQHVIHGYVGSMYGYSHDISIKNAPEDFVFYTPKGVNYTTTYIDYTINKSYQVTGEGKPHQGQYFVHYNDGSTGCYCTFMGGDCKITVVRTSTKNHRRLIILKDSFGNAIPGYLFYSFEEIHIIDNRYFTKNMRKYVADNKITDILFGNNIFTCYSSKKCAHYSTFLTQGSGTFAAPTPAVSAPTTPSNKPTQTVTPTKQVTPAATSAKPGTPVAEKKTSTKKDSIK